MAKTPAYAATTRVGLGTADGFAVLGGSAISDTPTSVISGDVGLSPGGGASITGLKCSEVTGTIYDTNGGYTGNGGGTACRTTNSGLLTTAQNDLTTAYNDAAGRSVTSTVGTELGGSTLTDGVYNSADGTFGLTGTLTLNGQGNADSVFIFKMATTLTTAASSKVVLTNGAQACNVYWQVGSAATLGTSTTLIGNVLALAAITDDGSSTVNGRLLARTAGAVTLNKTTVTKQTCAEGSAGGPVGPASTTGPKTTSSSNDCIASPITTVPIILKSNRVSPTSVFVSWGPYAGIDTFNVRYGLTNGNWLYNTNVTGFSTTINALPVNQPIWIEVAAKNNCAIGTYGESKLVGGPLLPNTGFAPNSCSPMRLVIPAINVNANIQNTGITSKGVMETPNNAVDAGWFDLGPRPGEKGSAVIAGHFDGKNGEAGVFTNLNKLKPGDKLYVQDYKGASTTFTVSGNRIYDPGYADEVFSSNDGTHLNLITCDGVWDGDLKSYSKRLVVFTDITQ